MQWTDANTLNLAVAIVAFIIVVVLLIFAPASRNFYDISKFSIKDMPPDAIEEVRDHLNIMMENQQEAVEWYSWPDKTAVGDIAILPIYFQKKVWSTEEFGKLCGFLRSMQVESIYIVKMPKGTHFRKHSGWAHLSNQTLRYVYCIHSMSMSDRDAGIWINGQIKTLKMDDVYVYDSSIEHSLYNDTYDDIYLLFVDLPRLNSARGISENKVDPSSLILKKINCVA